jgi:ankyrin repeat protein
LHAALCKHEHVGAEPVVRVLLAAGAAPNARTTPGVETGCFMRDVRTTGETPLHRAAAYASEPVIRLLVDAGAVVDAKDAHGDSPLAWASRHLRPDAVLRLLCYGPHAIHPERMSMEVSLRGRPE